MEWKVQHISTLEVGGVETVARFALSLLSFISSYLCRDTKLPLEIAISPDSGPSGPSSPLGPQPVPPLVTESQRGRAVARMNRLDLDHHCRLQSAARVTQPRTRIKADNCMYSFGENRVATTFAKSHFICPSYRHKSDHQIGERHNGMIGQWTCKDILHHTSS